MPLKNQQLLSDTKLNNEFWKRGSIASFLQYTAMRCGMKKKILTVLLAMFLVFAVSACGSEDSSSGGNGNYNGGGMNYNGGGSNFNQKNVCGICGGTGMVNQVMYYDMNGMPVWGMMGCGGCGGMGYY